MSDGRIPVLITTNKDLRGVFFGYIDPEDAEKDTIRVTDVQMAVYWCGDVHGVLGLAATGPLKGSRITKPAKSGIIKGITLVAECSKEAVKAWKSTPWS
jgi:hypothetical protein